MSKMSENKLICITGTMGSGKSSVSKQLQELGFEVLDLDAVVGELYQDKAIAKEVNMLLFNKEEKSINSKAISMAIFNNPSLRIQLEQLLYPKVYKVMQKFKKHHKIGFVEMALVFEKKWDVYFDEIICVYSDYEIGIERLMNNRGFSRDEIERRLVHQYDAEYKMSKSDYLIENNSDMNNLKLNVIDYLKERGLYEK